MKRIGVISIILILLFIISCGEEEEGPKRTGVEIRFQNCLTFGVWVFIDGSFKGTYSSDEPFIIDLPAGSHELEARSNYVITGEDIYFCWQQSFSVSDGKITRIVLDCDGHTCQDTTSTD